MDELFKAIVEMPLANLFIVVGFIFLLIGVVGDISGKITPGKNGRIASGIIGIISLGLGGYMYLTASYVDNTFKAGNYKDGFNNIYTVTGPDAATGERTHWSIQKTKPAGNFEGFWTTGPIAGHPIQPILTAQKITSKSFSWGTTVSNLTTSIIACGTGQLPVGFLQIGNQLTLHGFCIAGSAVETGLFTLSLCTAANPCT